MCHFFDKRRYPASVVQAGHHRAQQTASRKTLEQKFIFQIGTLNPHGINERFSFN